MNYSPIFILFKIYCLLLLKLKLVLSQETIKSFKPGGQYVLLTFDVGLLTNTPAVLDVLKKKQARATFFIKGSLINLKNVSTLTRICSERHDVQSLGWDQDTFGLTTPISVREEQIERTSDLIRKYTGNSPTVIRSPHGLSSKEMNKAVFNAHGLKTLLWSIDSRDWEITDPKAIVSHICLHVQPGDIINLHDAFPHSAETVSLLVDELNAKGYELLTVREIMSFPDDSPK